MSDDHDPMAGPLTMFVAFCTTIYAVGTGASIEVFGLTALLWVSGTFLKLAEIDQ